MNDTLYMLDAISNNGNKEANFRVHGCLRLETNAKGVPEFMEFYLPSETSIVTPKRHKISGSLCSLAWNIVEEDAALDETLDNMFNYDIITELTCVIDAMRPFFRNKQSVNYFVSDDFRDLEHIDTKKDKYFSYNIIFRDKAYPIKLNKQPYDDTLIFDEERS